MRKALRFAFAILIGVVVGGMINMGLVMLGPQVIAPPEGADLSTPEGLAEAIPLMQARHFLFPWLGHALGTLLGAGLAALIAARRKLVVALVIGVFFLAGGIINIVTLPSPLWFTVVDLGLAYWPMAWLGARLAGSGATGSRAVA
jgi:hypothetical protein